LNGHYEEQAAEPEARMELQMRQHGSQRMVRGLLPPSKSPAPGVNLNRLSPWSVLRRDIVNPNRFGFRRLAERVGDGREIGYLPLLGRSVGLHCTRRGPIRLLMDEGQISACLELFDLPDSFSEAQLKQAYHDLVQVWHPDKHSHNERLRRKAEEKMKEINQAYQVLQAGLRNGRLRFEQSMSRSGSPSPGKGPSDWYPPPPAAQSRPAEPPAQEASHAMAGGKGLGGLSENAFWILVIGMFLLVVMVVAHGRKTAVPETPQVWTPPTEGEPPLFATIEGPEGETNGAHSLVSKALDGKDGFKDLKFGMTIDEARQRWRPERITTNQYDQVATFWYRTSVGNKLGDLPLDEVNAFFFRGRLFKIEVSFSRNQEQIFDALQRSFGPAVPNDSLTRGSASLRA
jgi:curved DNA-binding protein CbpA